MLDGYPLSYQTANDVFFITPEAPKKAGAKAAEGEEGEEAEPAQEEAAEGEEVDPATLLPKF